MCLRSAQSHCVSIVADSGETTGLKYQAPTVNTVVDAKGDLLVATADNTIARLAVGANDTVLVAASGETTGLKWAAPASGGGMTLLSTTTLSSTSTSINIASGYKDIEIYVKNWYASSGSNNVFYGFNSDTTSANYNYAGVSIRETTAGQLYTANGARNFSRSNPTAAADNHVSVFRLYDYLSTDTFKTGEWISNYKVNGTSTYELNFAKFVWKSTSAITSIEFSHETGGVTWSGGTVEIYGVK